MKKFKITIDGKDYEAVVEELSSSIGKPTMQSMPVAQIAVPKVAPALNKPIPAAPKQAQGGNDVAAPMPGTITEVRVTVGQHVNAGDVVCVLEAMKMETDILAAHSGIIESVNVSKGAKVATGDVMITIK